MPNEIQAVLEPVLLGTGVHLYSIHVVNSPKQKTVEVFLDKAGGLTVDDCSSIYRKFLKNCPEAVWDDFDISFSSPGIGRDCQFPVDFLFYPERDFLIRTKEGKDLCGKVKILDTENQELQIEGDASVVRLKWSEVKQAHFHLPL